MKSKIQTAFVLLLLVAVVVTAGCAEDTRVYCTEEQRDVEICTTLHDPVCGSDRVTYTNDCVACQNPEVEYYIPGEC